jgi:hypothetical protein
MQKLSVINNNMKNKKTLPLGITLFTTIILIFSSCSSSVKEKNLIGKTFDFDSFHKIQFKTSTRYWIYQKPLSCGGEGNWSVSNGKVVLGPNDSQCESTKKISGTFDYSDFE